MSPPLFTLATRSLLWLLVLGMAVDGGAETARQLVATDIGPAPKSLRTRTGDAREFTWWLPTGIDELILPVAGGVRVRTDGTESGSWLRRGSPWTLTELPLIGARYGDRTLVVIVPWPHYAELVVRDRVGVRFAFPAQRNNTTPCEIVAQWAGPEPLAAAHAFRRWRQSAKDTGAVPRPRSLARKTADLPKVSRLLGAPHFYLWGPTMFCRHDVNGANWPALARTLRDAPVGSDAARLRTLFTADQQLSLAELARSEWPVKGLTLEVAAGIDAALASRALAGLPAAAGLREVVATNRSWIGAVLAAQAAPPESWGDGFSVTLLDELDRAGIGQALLILSDLHGTAVRPDVVSRAETLGYLLGPYDSYHSIHSPDAPPDETWETAQFDRPAYLEGRVVKAAGERQGGFKGRGFHFAPAAAWPYVQRRVGSILENQPFSTWFVDCDATAECFDDYSVEHPATRVEDVESRRRRLRWLETDKQLVVGSEGGSVLFADVIHFGHGVDVPYLGHLDPAFSDKSSPHFLGAHWPPDTPANSFKPAPVPPTLRTPYFDPPARIPLYRAALGDEVVVTHHWSFDSLKFSDLAGDRELMELLQLAPPLYHLNREAWPLRKDRIRRHYSFWSPLHRELAGAPLVDFEWLTEEALLQRTTFRTAKGDVAITVNFSTEERRGFPARSATVTGATSSAGRVFQTE